MISLIISKGICDGFLQCTVDPVIRQIGLYAVSLARDDVFVDEGTTAQSRKEVQAPREGKELGGRAGVVIDEDEVLDASEVETQAQLCLRADAAHEATRGVEGEPYADELPVRFGPELSTISACYSAMGIVDFHLMRGVFLLAFGEDNVALLALDNVAEDVKQDVLRKVLKTRHIVRSVVCESAGTKS
ncbi:hypothetical protein PG985_013576 [Apiospora marii]|uniref:uncharacterized protein n=1 Tax=Apiospora marii TaxID=335849 RepID=UPI00312FC3E0